MKCFSCGADDGFGDARVCHRCGADLDQAAESLLDAIEDRVGRDLFWAVCLGTPSQVKRLLAQGADPNTRSTIGVPVLTHAAFHGTRGTMRLLLRAGAEPNAADPDGYTALHAAAREQRGAAAVKLLLAGGASPGVRNRRGETPADVAATPQIKRLLMRGR